MSPRDLELSGRTRPGPLPFPLIAEQITANVEFSPAQLKQITLMNLAYFKAVAELDLEYVAKLYKMIDDISLKG